ncbi:MAG TPA: DUF5596 domain-containing protein [Tissierellia bacterium]|nr:DUF5596 domain-containing protein [Tissierellia bacterium]
MKLENIISELHFIGDVEKAILQKISRDKKSIEKISKTAYQGEKLNFALCRRMPLTRLSVVIYLLTSKYEEYRAKGISDDVIFDTFRDVSLRATLYYKKTGKVGISKEDVIWFRHIMNVSIFKIGSLQFQPFQMIYLDEETLGEPYMTFTKEQKKALPSGSPVLNCHIQQGADLSFQSVDASFQRAKIFFSELYPNEQYKAFLCYSWMLFPPMLRNLSVKSNIKRFANRFSIIGDCPDSEQAIEFLFGSSMRKETSENTTSLQRLAIKHPELLGFACGIITL